MTGSRQRHRPLSSAARPRDEAWFEALFRTHHAAVLAFARRRAPTHADDIVAEVFAVAWRRRDELPPEPLPWLYRAAWNHILHARRGEARQSRTAQAAALQDGADTSTDDPGDRVAAALDSQALIRSALEGLPVGDQDVLRLWAWEGLGASQIAYVLGSNGGAIRVRLHRALHRLRAAVLAAQGPAASTTSPATARLDTLAAAATRNEV